MRPLGSSTAYMESCNTCWNLYYWAHIEIIHTVQDDYHPLGNIYEQVLTSKLSIWCGNTATVTSAMMSCQCPIMCCFTMGSTSHTKMRSEDWMGFILNVWIISTWAPWWGTWHVLCSLGNLGFSMGFIFGLVPWGNGPSDIEPYV